MRVLVIDDDALIAQSLATILGAEPDIDVVGTGSSGAEAIEQHRELAPDALLMDIRMPGMDGLAAAETILAESPGARIVFLTTFADDDYIVRALRMGARGYLIKQDIAQIAPALRSVMAGVSVLEGQVLERTTVLRAGADRGEQVRAQAFAPLTDREFEVVQGVAEALDNEEIAERLFMSVGTVRNHISSILAKLGLRNRTQVAVAYYRSARAG